jgi:8-oxo-dGTP pyrophosphatase MutT (NUDIX family)
MGDTDDLGNPAIPSGTVAVLRDRPEGGIEVLMVRRAADVRDHFSGLWVFPGGAVEVDDHLLASGELEVARIAAVRETREEAGIDLEAATLEVLDRWEAEPRRGPQRRYSTWAFLAPAPEGEVQVDGLEIHEHRWIEPAEVIERHAADEMGMAPPTWISLLKLAEHSSVAEAISWARGRTPDDYRSRVLEIDGVVVIVWSPDELHDGPADERHRLILEPGNWRYERSG